MTGHHEDAHDLPEGADAPLAVSARLPAAAMLVSGAGSLVVVLGVANWKLTNSWTGWAALASAGLIIVLLAAVGAPAGRRHLASLSSGIIVLGAVGILVGGIGLADRSGGDSSSADEAGGSSGAVLNGRRLSETGRGPRFCGTARNSSGGEKSICARSLEGFNSQIPSGYRVDLMSLELDDSASEPDAGGFRAGGFLVMAGAAVAASGGAMLRRRGDSSEAFDGGSGIPAEGRLATVAVYSGDDAQRGEPTATFAACLMFGSPGSPGPVTGASAYVGRALEGEADRRRLDGRVAVVERGGDTFDAKASRVASVGAVAVVLINDTDDDDMASASVEGSPIPLFAISRSDGWLLLGSLRRTDTPFDVADPSTWDELHSARLELVVQP